MRMENLNAREGLNNEVGQSRGFALEKRVLIERGLDTWSGNFHIESKWYVQPIRMGFDLKNP